GNPSWLPDGRSFFYNRFQKTAPGAPETDKFLNSRAYLHIVGKNPDTDVALVGTGLNGVPLAPLDVPFIVTTPGSSWALAVVSRGAQPQIGLYVAPLAEAGAPGAHWRKVAETDDDVVDFQLAGSRLFLETFKNAPRFKIVEVRADAPDLAHA